MAMCPHVLFWPFDVGTAPPERERTRPASHIADALRLGVLAEDEGAELRLEGHIMACLLCREPALALWGQMPEAKDAAAFVRQVSCAQARNSLLRYLEQGRRPELAVLSHVLSCLTCSDHFLGVAKALYTLEVDEGAVAAQD
ncbi:MAG: hypothetical protein ACE5IZ_02595 [Dehalococcoidia bacterium]